MLLRPLGGLRIIDITGWLLGSVIVWLITALLPLIFLRRKIEGRGARRR